jgi:hypothetical protein
MPNREGIAQEIKRLEEMLKDLKPRRTGPSPRTRPDTGNRKGPRPNKRRPVKKPNAPGGSKPARKRIIKRKNKPTPGFGTGRST